jgi:hypothetical protein
MLAARARPAVQDLERVAAAVRVEARDAARVEGT